MMMSGNVFLPSGLNDRPPLAYHHECPATGMAGKRYLEKVPSPSMSASPANGWQTGDHCQVEGWYDALGNPNISLGFWCSFIHVN